MFDYLVEMTGSVFADRLVHQAQGESPWFEGARIVGLGRAACADVAHLRARQFREPATPGEGIPIEALVGVTPDEGPHLAGQINWLGLRGNWHGRIPIGSSIDGCGGQEEKVFSAPSAKPRCASMRAGGRPNSLSHCRIWAVRRRQFRGLAPEADCYPNPDVIEIIESTILRLALDADQPAGRDLDDGGPQP